MLYRAASLQLCIAVLSCLDF
uniref:Uncharacterized protein n=1 Tax=Arundo donax TaxID=35708 RepID=A0A0A9A0T8_ARUDO